MEMKVNVYLEVGKKRAFTGAIDWPGWCRSGKDETAALQTLFDYGKRYGSVCEAGGLDFIPPIEISGLKISERLKGNATTDFGAPGVAPSIDSKKLDLKDLKRFEDLLKACWRALDSARESAGKRHLRLGPRGGGRQIDQIIRHLSGADVGYLRALGMKFNADEEDISAAALKNLRNTILEALEASARGEIPNKGPRGGNRWTPRYFVRRVAWHTLDHAWEIEDRL